MQKDVSCHQHNERGAAMPEKADDEVDEMREKPQSHDRNHHSPSNQNPRTDMSKIDHHFDFPF